MTAYICVTCGVQYPPAEQPPAGCPICEDERQYVGWRGQQWTTMVELAEGGRRAVVREEETGLYSLETQPPTAIGQRALIVRTAAGNVMWDCTTFADDEAIEAVGRIGGLAAIAISHPHFYASYPAWSAAFGDCPVYIHASDREWVQSPVPGLTLWDGVARDVLPGVRLLNPGGHFEGAALLYWAGGAGGRGALLVGDTIMVVMDRRFVSFMYSFPNLVPLSGAAVARILETVRPYPYDRIYGAWPGRVVAMGGSEAVERSARRYLAAIR
jgi:hypothetical protein